jgi:hypothetical protein
MHANTIDTGPIEIRIKGKNTLVPSIRIEGRTIVHTGKWLKTAAVRDEGIVQGETVPDPELFIAQLKQCMRADNVAAIRITTYQDWLKNQVKKDVKENLRRAAREGVTVRTSPYDDKLVQGIKDLCDETPIRQGMSFWHHGKSFEAIKEVHGTYRERAEYIAAYFQEELIGFIKMVYVDNYAKTMHVISKEKYFQKRPTNALIAKAVEVCEQKGLNYFIYGEARYLGKKTSSLADFKRRNGFEEIQYPRYFVPLTVKGKLAIKFGLQLGLMSILPKPVIQLLLTLRSKRYANSRPSEKAPKKEADLPKSLSEN